MAEIVIKTPQDLESFFKSKTYLWLKTKTSFLLYDQIKKQIEDFFNTAQALNQKYPQFPAFSFKIYDNIHSSVPELYFNLTFNNYDLAFFVFSANRHTSQMWYSSFIYTYVHGNLYDVATYLKSINNTSRLLEKSYYMDYTSTTKDIPHLVTYLQENSNVNFEPLDVTILKDKYDLTKLIYLLLNPFDESDVSINHPLYINTYCTNILRFFKMFKRQQIAYLFINNAYSIRNFLKFNGIYKNSEKISYEYHKDIADDFPYDYYYMTSELGFKWFSTYISTINYLLTYDNLSYRNQADNLTGSTILTNIKDGKLKLDQVRTMTQTLNFSAGLKHGTDVEWFYSPEQNNTPAASFFSIDNYYFTSYQNWNKHVLYQTITFSNPFDLDSVFNVTLSPKELYSFIKYITEQINFNQAKKISSYNTTFQANTKLLHQTISNHLTDLPVLFPNKTVLVKKQLTFNQNPSLPNYYRSQMFLSYGPRFHPNANNQILTFTNIYGAFNIDQLYGQNLSFVNLQTRNTLIQFFYKNMIDHPLNVSLDNYWSFIAYLCLYFKHHILYHKTFGYIAHSITYDNILYGYMTTNTYDQNKQATSDMDLKNMNLFYDQFLSAFYDTFLSDEFITAFHQLVETYPQTQSIRSGLKEKVQVVYRKDLKRLAKQYNDPNNIQELETFFVHNVLISARRWSFYISDEFVTFWQRFEYQIRQMILEPKDDDFIKLMHTYMQKVVELIPGLEIRSMDEYKKEIEQSLEDKVLDHTEIAAQKNKTFTNIKSKTRL